MAVAVIVVVALAPLAIIAAVVIAIFVAADELHARGRNGFRSERRPFPRCQDPARAEQGDCHNQSVHSHLHLLSRTFLVSFCGVGHPQLRASARDLSESEDAIGTAALIIGWTEI